MVEMATGKFPYNTWGTPFEQLKQVQNGIRLARKRIILLVITCLFMLQVVKDDPPRLEPGKFTLAFENLISACLQKKYTDRPNYEQLLQHAFLVENMNKETNVAAFVEEILALPDA